MMIIIGQMVVDPEGNVGMVMAKTSTGRDAYVMYVNNGPYSQFAVTKLRVATSAEIDAAGLSGVGRLPAPDEEK